MSLPIDDTHDPACFGEAPVPGTDVALCVRMHIRKAAVPEEPDILFVHDRLGVEEVMIYVGI